MTRIAVLHPGAMGARVGAALVECGHDVVWLPEGRGMATADRAHHAGLRGVTDLDGCDLVLSVVPPMAAVDTARWVAGYRGRYVDANAISPATARQVAAIVTAGGATYTDGGIIGLPPDRSGSTRLYLSGPDAGGVAPLFDGAKIEARVLDDGGPYAASALKMTYAAWTKISAALVLAARSAAESLGVEQALAAEWALSQPGLEWRWELATRDGVNKGWRWTDEMREIARTLSAAGQPGGFGEAAAELFSRFTRPDDTPSS